MNRRNLLRSVGAAALMPALLGPGAAAGAVLPFRRVRPSDPAWPSPARWQALSDAVGGRLVQVRSPLKACVADAADCAKLFKDLKNPYFIGDTVGLTQTLGWAGAWTSQPSAYAVEAQTTQDVVEAVNFARRHHLRLVVKGGGHSYQGTSNAPDSLLIWTRKMNAVTLHDAFVGQGCEGHAAPQPAVTVEAGAMWIQAYDAVTTQAGRYVQGGGCTTVGVAGLIQSGGFGSFSKNYGLASAGLLQAEVVTADGQVRIANAHTNPDLFWGLKGGGGGSLGVVTRLTLRTRDLPAFFGAANMTIQAHSDEAYRRLIARIISFYAESLFNPHWGEQIGFHPGNILTIAMVFQGLDEGQAQAVWRPFLDWLAAHPQDFTASKPMILAIPARHMWDARMLKAVPGVVRSDDRPGADDKDIFWTGDAGQVGWFLHAFQSAWMPAQLLRADQQPRFCDALFAASRSWSFGLHVNKGLAGAPPEAIAAARDTAMNPAVLDAFALLITGAAGPPAYPGIAGHEPDLGVARRQSDALNQAMRPIHALAPAMGAYLSESDYFDDDWRRSYWGSNHERLAKVKRAYDPEGLFVVHHGIGSEGWSADGFTRLT